VRFRLQTTRNRAVILSFHNSIINLSATDAACASGKLSGDQEHPGADAEIGRSLAADLPLVSSGSSTAIQSLRGPSRKSPMLSLSVAEQAKAISSSLRQRRRMRL
jgi:hypothetical protein